MSMCVSCRTVPIQNLEYSNYILSREKENNNFIIWNSISLTEKTVCKHNKLLGIKSMVWKQVFSNHKINVNKEAQDHK
jgi:hypothetical protein